MLGKKYECYRSKLRKFITFGYDHLVFKDSFAFLQSSIDKLVKLNKYKEVDGVDVLIDKWKDNFKLSKQNPRVTNDDDLFFATEKGVYPYDYMNSWDKFNET